MSKASQAAEVGNKFGDRIDQYTNAFVNIAEELLVNYCNEGIKLMRSKIYKTARTGTSSTLAASINLQPIKKTADSVSIATTSDLNYWKFVDKGVKGVRKNRAGNSPYKFRTLGVGDNMLKSFKEYIARTGSTGMSGKKLTGKNKKKQKKDIESEAYAMARATKKSGIKPMRFVREANNKERNKELSDALSTAMGRAIIVSIKKYGNNNK